MRHAALAIALLPLLGACPSENEIQARVHVDEWYQEPTDQVDILWVIDDSNSMRAEQETLVAGFASFALELENTGADFHIGVITTTFLYDDPERGKLLGEPPVISKEHPNYIQLFAERAVVGVDGDGKEKGLEAAAWALSPIMTTGNGHNVGFLRPEAHLLVVFVSDEDDCSDEGGLEGAENTACYSEWDKLVPVGDFVTEIEAIKENEENPYAAAQLAAIVGPEVTSGCIDATPGTRYIEAARLTGGLVGNICESDWSGILYDLGLNAVGIHTTFELEHGAVVGTLVVRVDDVAVPESDIDGWTYDSEYYTITFHGSAIPERGSVIEAEYEVVAGT